MSELDRELKREFKRQGKSLVALEKELTIVFLDQIKARELNKKFRGRNYATDVLSFGVNDDSNAGGAEILGELVICPEVISRQAKEHSLLVREELGYMVLHGVLHLLGFDHEKSKKEAEKMFALQDRIFEALLKRVAKTA